MGSVYSLTNVLDTMPICVITREMIYYTNIKQPFLFDLGPSTANQPQCWLTDAGVLCNRVCGHQIW